MPACMQAACARITHYRLTAKEVHPQFPGTHNVIATTVCTPK